jgi:hypothetical protein
MASGDNRGIFYSSAVKCTGAFSRDYGVFFTPVWEYSKHIEFSIHIQ